MIINQAPQWTDYIRWISHSSFTRCAVSHAWTLRLLGSHPPLRGGGKLQGWGMLTWHRAWEKLLGENDGVVAGRARVVVVDGWSMVCDGRRLVSGQWLVIGCWRMFSMLLISGWFVVGEWFARKSHDRTWTNHGKWTGEFAGRNHQDMFISNIHIIYIYI